MFGKFAQIGYLVEFWGQASGSDSARARRYLKELVPIIFKNKSSVRCRRASMTKPYSIILHESCAGMDPGARELFSFRAESR